jgi:hypothetical protein
MRYHGHSSQRIAEQFEWMYSRIAVVRARELARPLYERTREILAERSGAGQPRDLSGG